MRRTLILTAALLAGLSASALAADKPEDLLKGREGLFQALKWQVGPLMGFAKGDAPLPADAADRAANIVALSKILPQAFRPGTENLPGSHAKAEAFSKPEFVRGFTVLGDAGMKLQTALASGDEAAIKAAIPAVGKACKACHDDFRSE